MTNLFQKAVLGISLLGLVGCAGEKFNSELVKSDMTCQYVVNKYIPEYFKDSYVEMEREPQKIKFVEYPQQEKNLIKKNGVRYQIFKTSPGKKELSIFCVLEKPIFGEA